MAECILVATDFSELSDRALIQGAHLAGQFNLPLFLVHAVEPIADASDVDDETQQFHKQLLEAAREKLKLQTGALGNTGVQVTALAELGPRVQTLVKMSLEQKPRYLVMGHSVRGNDGQPHVGISLKVLCMADCPVLMVP